MDEILINLLSLEKSYTVRLAENHFFKIPSNFLLSFQGSVVQKSQYRPKIIDFFVCVCVLDKCPTEERRTRYFEHS